MSVILQSPRNFLPLLLFIGLILLLLGIGFLSVTSNATLVTDGFLLITVAVVLFVLMNRKKMGF